MTTKAISAGWPDTPKLLMIRVYLLLILAFVGCYVYSEHIRLEAVTGEHNEAISSYSQTIDELTEQNNDLNNELAMVSSELAATNSKLVTAESAPGAAFQSYQETAVGLAADSPKLATTASAPGGASSYGASGQASEFASYAGLIAWLKKDDTHTQPYSPTFECVDFAFMMSEHAIKDGYWIFPAVDLANGHMQCIAPIGNDLYAIEPQNNAVSLWAVKSDP